MDVPCQACFRGPAGIAGHGELNVHTIGDGRMMLRCQACGAFWSRTIAREGYFTWAPLTERMAAGAEMGVAVPPRSFPPEYPGLSWRVAPPRRSVR